MLECARNNTVRDVSHCGGGALRRYKRLIGVEEVMAIRRAALPMATVSKVVLAAKTAGVTDDTSLRRRALELLPAWGVVGTAWKRGLAPDVAAVHDGTQL